MSPDLALFVRDEYRMKTVPQTDWPVDVTFRCEDVTQATHTPLDSLIEAPNIGDAYLEIALCRALRCEQRGLPVELHRQFFTLIRVMRKMELGGEVLWIDGNWWTPDWSSTGSCVLLRRLEVL